VPFEVKNTADIEKLIQCESQGVNINRPDSNGLISWGIYQFNRTPPRSDLQSSAGPSSFDIPFSFGEATAY
jgi:hypothetical protein